MVIVKVIENCESLEFGRKQFNDFAHHIWHLPKCPVLQSFYMVIYILMKHKNLFVLLACN